MKTDEIFIAKIKISFKDQSFALNFEREKNYHTVMSKAKAIHEIHQPERL